MQVKEGASFYIDLHSHPSAKYGCGFLENSAKQGIGFGSLVLPPEC
jgi:hypothetical protein